MAGGEPGAVQRDDAGLQGEAKGKSHMKAAARPGGKVKAVKRERPVARVVRREEKAGRKHVFVAGRVEIAIGPKDLKR